MTIQERKSIIQNSKKKENIISGVYVDLRPCIKEYGEAIVRLRNQEKSRFSFNQKEPTTIEKHNKWFNDLMQRDNDIYWCVHDKFENIIGVIRLYDIKHDGISCRHGSFIIDENFAMNGPYTLETEILILDFAFDVLQINKILTDDRVENKNMNSISKRIGMQFIEVAESNGAHYNLYKLTKDTYNRDKLINILNRWQKRDSF